MALCASGILMSALTLALILADIYHDRLNYITEHAILGGTVTILFFTLCNYGYEVINWALLAIVPIFIFFKWLFSETSECDTCDSPKKSCGCDSPKKSCGCEEPELKEPEKKEPKKYKSLSCPAKGGMKMGDQCGVSRFT